MDHTFSARRVNGNHEDNSGFSLNRLPGTDALSADFWAILNKVAVQTVKDWVKDNKIPHRNIGGTWWIEPADFLTAFPKSDIPEDGRKRGRTKRGE